MQLVYPLKIGTYPKPNAGVDRILLFGEHSLTPEEDSDPCRAWYGGWWCKDTQAFHADGGGFIVSVTHWMSLPDDPPSS